MESQLDYADLQENVGNFAMSEYIRFRANSGPQSNWQPSDWNRQRELLDTHPECWDWDNFLALAELPSYQDRIREHCDPEFLRELEYPPELQVAETVGPADVANANQLEELETLIGRRLPLGYRTFLSEIGNGSVIEQLWRNEGQNKVAVQFQQIFSTSTIIKRLRDDADQLEAAKLPCELNWAQLMGLRDKAHDVRPATARYSKDGTDGGENRFYIGQMSIQNQELYEADPDDHRAYEFGHPAGMIQIGNLSIERDIFLAVEGELSGTIWIVTYDAGDSLFCYQEVKYWGEMYLLARGRQKTTAARLPIDTLPAICELVLDLVPYRR